MKIKYEAEIKDCSQCLLLLRLCDKKGFRCNQDLEDAEVELNHNGTVEKIIKLPCQIRPCPIEIK